MTDETTIVRRAVESDTAAVQAVGILTWPATYLPFTSPDFVLHGLATWWSADAVLGSIVNDTTLVAEVDGVVVGTATLGTLGDRRVLWKLYVAPARQGTGVGRALMRAVLDEVADEPVLVEFVEGNERARGFYERHGFVPDHTEVQDGEPASIWLIRHPGVRPEGRRETTADAGPGRRPRLSLRSVPEGLTVSLHRALIRPGMEDEATRWMQMLNDRHDEAVATLERERMAVEIVFRSSDAGGDHLTWICVHGPGDSVSSSDHALDVDHLEFDDRVRHPVWETAQPQLLLLPAPVLDAVTTWALPTAAVRSDPL